MRRRLQTNRTDVCTPGSADLGQRADAPRVADVKPCMIFFVLIFLALGWLAGVPFVLAGFALLRGRIFPQWAPRRAVGYASLGAGAVVLAIWLRWLIAVNVDSIRRSVEEAKLFKTLTQPVVYQGIRFPAGSKVTLRAGSPNRWETVEVPGPILWNGLPVEGEITFGQTQEEQDEFDHGQPTLESATLARPASVDGLPCARGPVKRVLDKDVCTLATDYVMTASLWPAAPWWGQPKIPPRAG